MTNKNTPTASPDKKPWYERVAEAMRDKVGNLKKGPEPDQETMDLANLVIERLQSGEAAFDATATTSETTSNNTPSVQPEATTRGPRKLFTRKQPENPIADEAPVQKTAEQMLVDVMQKNPVFKDNILLVGTLVSLLGDDARPGPSLIEEMGISKEAVEAILQALLSKMNQSPVSLRNFKDACKRGDYIPLEVYKDILLLGPKTSEAVILEKADRLNKAMARMPKLLRFFQDREGGLNEELIENINDAIQSIKTNPHQNMADLASMHRLPLNKKTDPANPAKLIDQEQFEAPVALQMIEETKQFKPAETVNDDTSSAKAEPQEAGKSAVDIEEILLRPEVAPIMKVLKRFQYAIHVDEDTYEEDLKAKFNDLPQLDLWTDVTQKCNSIFLVIETKMGPDKPATSVDIATIVAEEFGLQNDETVLIAKLNEIRDALIAEYPDAIK